MHTSARGSRSGYRRSELRAAGQQWPLVSLRSRLELRASASCRSKLRRGNSTGSCPRRIHTIGLILLRVPWFLDLGFAVRLAPDSRILFVCPMRNVGSFVSFVSHPCSCWLPTLDGRMQRACGGKRKRKTKKSPAPLTVPGSVAASSYGKTGAGAG